MSNAGKWTIEVSDPHPCGVRIKKAGDPVYIMADHRDLHDLHYAVGRAIKEARDKLP